jgi:hypothetical protein
MLSQPALVATSVIVAGGSSIVIGVVAPPSTWSDRGNSTVPV